MEHPIQGQSTKLNDNRISFYVAQRRKCAICKESLLLGDMEVHHITPKSSGGKDNYSNLALVTGDVHKLIHATDPVIVQKYLDKLKHCKLDMAKLNKFRLLVFALLIPAVVALLRYLIRTFMPELSRRMDQNLSSVIYNCAALGSALLISLRSLGFLSGVIFALFGGIGATIALASFASLQNEVDLERCPSCFRGLPIKLITAGLMALSLVGFYGLNFQ